MAVKIYVDGNSGTTGLKIHERLTGRADVELLTLPEELRKDPSAKKEVYAAADAVFFCLPDAASREAAALVEELPERSRPRILDTSTAHRTDSGWVYGFPELSPEQRRQVSDSPRTAVPGCHASGYIALTRPLVDAGLLDPAAQLSCFSLTGYSGGGKKMIAAYESADRPVEFSSPRMYALGQTHKHLPEMTAISRMSAPPVFCPTVGDFYSGMLVSVPLPRAALRRGSIEDVKAVYRALYRTPVVSFWEDTADENGFLAAGALSGRDEMRVAVYGQEDRILLTAVYDNLGKGASGAAVQCFNLMFGLPETTGLSLTGEILPTKG